MQKTNIYIVMFITLIKKIFTLDCILAIHANVVKSQYEKNEESFILKTYE